VVTSRRQNAAAGGSGQERARTGRRPGPSTTRTEILAAARESFAELGYDRTSVRAIAARAGDDPALVHRFFGSKDTLFLAALTFALDPDARIPEMMEGEPDTLGERVVRYFFSVWEGEPTGGVLVGLLRSAATNEQAATLLRDFFSNEVLGRIAAQLDVEDARLRATLLSSQLLGIAMARYIVRIPPVATAPQETLVAAYAPTIQRYLTADLGLPRPRAGSRPARKR
jgi:AcrR family transcriptional regulator